MTLDTAMPDHVLAIAQEIFTAMIDGHEGGLGPGYLGVADIADPMSAWVDVTGQAKVRAVLTTGADTCAQIARALLAIPPGEAVADGDLVDAAGEVANVVGGNLKSLIPDAQVLSLPQVAARLPASGALEYEVPLSWQGRPIVISLWNLAADTEGVMA